MFSGDKVTMAAGGIPDGKTTMKYLSGFVGFFIKPAIIVKAAKLILSKGETVVEPRHRGRVRR